LSFIHAELEATALYNANPKRMNSYTVAGTHNSHWLPLFTIGHPTRGDSTKDVIVLGRWIAFSTNITRNSPMEMRKRIPLKRAIFLEQLKRQ
jgi:hypothetical protein